MDGNKSNPFFSRDVYKFELNKPVVQFIKTNSEWNTTVKSIRTRIENIFTFIKNKFKDLKILF